MRLLTIAAVFWFLADQLSKIAVLHWAGLLERGVIEVFPPYLVFILGYNTGINFGLLSGGPEVARWVLVASRWRSRRGCCGGRAPGSRGPSP
jgi:signal peptidase II